MEGQRHSAISADGTRIGLLSAGSGRPLLLIHGGMGSLERWAPAWKALARRWRVTAMDRRGRGSSDDGGAYSLGLEFADVAAVATALAGDDGPIDVFGHSFGATCALGAAACGAPFHRIALYEPPGPQTVPRAWVERVTALIAEGNFGRAMYSFLIEIIGLSPERFEELKGAPGAEDVLAIVATTMAREAQALSEVDVVALAERVSTPTLLLLGSASPAWAGEITRSILATIPHSELVVLPDHGHEALDSAPDLVIGELHHFFERHH